MNMDLRYMAHIESIDKLDLGRLMDEYGDEVWRYAYAMTRNRELAYDISQEVFIRAYQKFHSFRGQSSIKTWLLSITRNLAINERKSAYLRRILLFERVHPGGEGASAESAYLDKQGERDLWTIIMGLSVKLREALVLDLEHDLPMAEMAKLLDVSEGTVKSRLSRARKAVEKALKEGTA